MSIYIIIGAIIAAIGFATGVILGFIMSMLVISKRYMEMMLKEEENNNVKDRT